MSLGNLIFSSDMPNFVISLTRTEKMLQSRICVDTDISKLTSEKSFSESFGTSGRLDAEYYQPKPRGNNF